MKYPSIDEYLAAMQAHARTVRDPLLASGSVEMGRWGTPLARSGTFALTFKVTASGRDYAFRCFQRDRAGMHRRYTAIHKALNRAPLPYFVDFAYLDPGIAVNGQTYPAIRMDWAAGEPLGAFIEANLRDTGRLRALLQQLHGMALALESAGIAHGDVQSNNILVAPTGELKLVDYDGMYVPGIASMGALETGHRNFQHPQRERNNPFDATLDRFSFALLHTAVSALVENPSTWTQLKADPEALLLRAADFADPARSSAFEALTKMPATGPAFQRLRDICARPYQSIPTFADFVAGRGAPRKTARKTSNSATNGTGTAKAGTANQARLAGLDQAQPATTTSSGVGGNQASRPVSTNAASGALPPPPPPPPPVPRMSKDLKIVGITVAAGTLAAIVGTMVVVILAVLLFWAAGSRDSPSTDTSLGSTADSPESSPTAPSPSAASPGPSISGIPVADITTCIEGKEVEKSCKTGSNSWTYRYCWASRNLALERLQGGEWNPISVITAGPDPQGCTDPEFPYGVEFTRTESTIGQTSYRVRATQDNYIHPFTASVTAPAMYFQTCFEPKSDSRYCQAGLGWSYDSCWQSADGVVLQQWLGGQWKTVKRDIAAKDSCAAGYPWSVKFQQAVVTPGTKKYRLYFPPRGQFAETIEPITVTVTIK